MSTDEIQIRRQELDSLTNKIIGYIYKVSNSFGCGFLEKVYENSLTMVNFGKPRAEIKRIVNNF